MTFEGIAGIIHFVERHGPQETEKTEYAGVAELADAQASGACGRKIVWVQVPSPAFSFCSSWLNRDTNVCRSGGIGRRAGFRCLWSQDRVGSSPISCIFFCLQTGKRRPDISHPAHSIAVLCPFPGKYLLVLARQLLAGYIAQKKTEERLSAIFPLSFLFFLFSFSFFRLFTDRSSDVLSGRFIFFSCPAAVNRPPSAEFR